MTNSRAKGARDFLAIDPGPHKSAIIGYDGFRHEIKFCDIQWNSVIAEYLPEFGWPLAIEMIASYGMPVGKDVFETCVWVGRFIEANHPNESHKVYRKDVKMHLCQSMKAKDANIRQALIDRFPATGGGKTPQIGTKSQPGPLYGIKSHLWAALGVAVTFAEKSEYLEAA